MEFKKLEIKPEGSWLKRTLWSAHARKTLIYVLLGALAGFIMYMLSGDKQISSLIWKDALSNMAIGAFFGFFLTNSPCARNKC